MHYRRLSFLQKIPAMTVIFALFGLRAALGFEAVITNYA